MMHAISHNTDVIGQVEVLVFETEDGQVFLQRGTNEEGCLELSIHEYDQLIEDAKAGKMDRRRD